MANSTSNTNMRPIHWGKRVFADAIRDTFFWGKSEEGKSGLISMAPIDSEVNSIIHVATDLKKKQGEAVRFALGSRLSGATGVTGDSELEGNETRAIIADEAVLIDKWRDAVRTDGALDEQKSANNLRENAKTQLAKKRTEFMERQVFLKLGGVTNTTINDTSGEVVGTLATWSNTPDFIPDADEAAGVGVRYICANSGGTDALAATDVMTPQLISEAKRKARLANPKIRPIRVDGQDYYAMFVHPNQGYDLKYDPIFAQAMRDAEVRGAKNPIFTGALGIWDGVILYEHEMVPFLDISVAGNSFRGAATGTDCAADCYRALLCGAQAAVWAECESPNNWVEKGFDYDDKWGVATTVLGGVQKTMFTTASVAKEYGVVAVDTASSRA